MSAHASKCVQTCRHRFGKGVVCVKYYINYISTLHQGALHSIN